MTNKHNKLDAYGNTDLQIAISSGIMPLYRIKEVASTMTDEDLAHQNACGNNVLHIAALNFLTTPDVVEYLCSILPQTALAAKNNRGLTPLEIAGETEVPYIDDVLAEHMSVEQLNAIETNDMDVQIAIGKALRRRKRKAPQPTNRYAPKPNGFPE